VPSVFPIATGLPVVVLSVLLVHGIATACRSVRWMWTVELWVRRTVGVVVIRAGIYLMTVVRLV
jgi:cytochrome c-type biogenesis protein